MVKTSVCGKPQCLLDIGEDKKRKFFGVMIKRQVFPPDGQSLFDLELEGGASLVNHVQADAIDDLA